MYYGHYPVWLSRGICWIKNNVAFHFALIHQSVFMEEAFQVIYPVPKQHPTAAEKRLLALAEAITAKYRDPDLCTQKQFMQTLTPNWPTTKRKCS